MAANPFYRLPYGDRYDDQILAALNEGLTSQAAAIRIGIGRDFIRYRARQIGPEDAWKQKAKKIVRKNASLPIRRPHTPSLTVTGAFVGRTDARPSDLLRALRQRLLIIDRDGLDPSHGVACLHAAGLTLDEIEGVTGVPVPAVIAAVRLHAEVRA